MNITVFFFKSLFYKTVHKMNQNETCKHHFRCERPSTTYDRMLIVSSRIQPASEFFLNEMSNKT